MKTIQVFALIFIITLISCGTDHAPIVFEEKPIVKLNLSEKELYDKVLGMIVGSVIGYAMGAPTEMWSREDIKTQYGYVTGLDSMVREASAEGPWKTNLGAGGTTDDTRWKKLTAEYLAKQPSKDLQAEGFAQAILDQYNASITNYSKIKSFDPEPFEENTLRVAWLQEWAKVSKPFIEKKYPEYHTALSKFYGGEMVCAGLLYAPAIGAFYPGDPTTAYNEMFNVSIYDLGYARDISALAAAMTAAGMPKDATKESIIAVLRSVDPQGYFKSRLVGRTSFNLFKTAQYLVNEARADTTDPLKKAFTLLDKPHEVMPFHAGEIYLEVLTAMLYADFDFVRTIQFLINYGRDNDTTAAVAGGILGAFYGFDRLPADKSKVIKVGLEDLDINMEALAQQMTRRIIHLN